MKKITVPLGVLRMRHGRLSQRKLSEVTGISKNTINRLETGKSHGIDFDTLAKLCEVFDCRPGDLFELEDIPPNQAGEELDDERLKEAIVALEKEGVPVFRSEEDVERVVRERAAKAMEDLKAGRTKSFAEIEAGRRRSRK